jgi:hypothetical protein
MFRIAMRSEGFVTVVPVERGGGGGGGSGGGGGDGRLRSRAGTSDVNDHKII